jgi:3-dehydroquinate dehydratase II
MKIQIINGPNLNLLGTRESSVYGTETMDEILTQLRLANPTVELTYFQSNSEGDLIDALQQFSGNGIILNAGGYTHTSVALRDAVAAISIPVVEVHISNIAGRESFRHDSLLSPVCAGCIFGFGTKGYAIALNYFLNFS